MFKAAIIGLGKMGLSHQSMVNAHPEIQLTAVCDASAYTLDVLSKYTGVKTYTDYKKMLAEERLDCVFVATPSRYHAEIVAAALDSGLHVFCEKPFVLDAETGYRLADAAERKKLVNQVGYHYRFIATFNEAKRLLNENLIGELHHVRAEAYGPVVLRAKGTTWRSHKSEGGGCLFDYASHAIDLLNFMVGRPYEVCGTAHNGVFSSDVDDEIYSTLHFAKGVAGQLATNWSDESFRKMSVKITLWGTNGRINVDRQEIQTYIRKLPTAVEGFNEGWNVRNTTDLTRPVWFYVRGEEYSAQIDHFVQCMKTGATAISNFRTASDTAMVTEAMVRDARKSRTAVERSNTAELGVAEPMARPRSSFLKTMFARR